MLKTNNKMEKSEKYLACLHWLEKIEDKTIREAAISQMDAEEIDKWTISISIAHAIFVFKGWHITKEESEFWLSVYDHYKDGTPLPDYPKHLLLESRVSELEEALSKIAKTVAPESFEEAVEIIVERTHIAEQALKGGNQ